MNDDGPDWHFVSYDEQTDTALIVEMFDPHFCYVLEPIVGDIYGREIVVGRAFFGTSNIFGQPPNG